MYRAGFARTQADYDRSVRELFETLGELEQRLRRQHYLLGERITESDWHLFCTLVRFDAAYHGALRCNLHRLIDYPALTAFTRRMYRVPGVAETVRFDHIKAHYHDALGELNPTIVPAGPAVDFRSVRSEL
ncbi:MAG: glutathione S-transferase family protein [Arhodomonas sp.]|nr:glutathione S-transferase family protein [Arhodomonas sp.]